MYIRMSNTGDQHPYQVHPLITLKVQLKLKYNIHNNYKIMFPASKPEIK